jgi:hypothetical protein
MGALHLYGYYNNALNCTCESDADELVIIANLYIVFLSYHRAT